MQRCFVIFLRNTVIVAALLLGAIITLNLLVDPFGIYHVIDNPKLNAAKSQAGSRVFKAEAIRQGDFDTFIYGSSRVAVGIDPACPSWGDRRPFNVGLAGAYFPELMDAVDYTLAHRSPRTMVICLDFYAFNDRARPSTEYEASRFNRSRWMADYHAEALTGMNSTKNSVMALVDVWRGARPEYSPLGLRLRPLDVGGTSVRYRAAHMLARAVDNFRTDGPPGNDVRCFDRLAALIRTARDRNIELILFIPPVHATMLELYAQLGFWPDYERWERKLVAVVDENGGDASTVSLWDFSGFAGSVAEPIPPETDPRATMRWYWESSHFRRELGDIAIDRMTSPRSLADESANNFGLRLDRSNIDQHLAGLRKDRDAFQATFPGEVDWVGRCAAAHE